MYYRRKILLALLQSFDNRLNKLNLQKLLFLATRQQEKKAFDFVPYKFGCFSFQANADLKTMTKYQQVSESNNEWLKTDDTDYMAELKVKDLAIIKSIKRTFGAYSADQLIEHTYKNYPFYAINSTITDRYLDNAGLEKVRAQKREKSETILYTIGYEGISLEQYINKLIIHDVKVLCDVRKNSYSMKYGFSKSQLANACKGVGIEFIHIPEVGIESDKRQELHTQSDYDALFALYRQTVLKDRADKQKEILQLLIEKKRIALTCFEANIHQCHRKHLAESISKLNGFSYELKHI